MFPEVPTFKESGYPEFEPTVWYGLLAPKGVPQALITQLHMTFLNVLGTKEMRERLAQDGVQFNAISAEEFGGWIKSERGKWGEVVRQVGAKID
jgi:tripartite-type tricarboxylate transporter receptor subunit TctC